MKEIKKFPINMNVFKAGGSQLMTVKNLTDQSADLYIYGEIVDNTDWKWDETDVMPDDVLKVLNQVEGLNNLNIFINSPGGSVFAGLAIYNMLKRNKAYKTVHVDGVAASMASVLALVGDKVIIPSNAFLMIHKPWTLAVGNSNDLRKVADDLEDVESGVMKVYEENLKDGVDIATVQGLVDAETWLNGEEAAKYFNIEVAEAKTIAACSSDYLARYDKTPKRLFENQEIIPTASGTNEKEKIKFQNELDLLLL